MKSTIGTAASGTFSDSNEMWFELDRAGSETGDRFWRFPNFWKIYTRRVTGIELQTVSEQLNAKVDCEVNK